MVLPVEELKLQEVYSLLFPFPFYEGAGLYSTRMHADRSYIIAAKTRTDYPGGMYISVDEPTRSPFHNN